MNAPQDDTPLLDEGVIGELFALADSVETQGMVRDMFAGMLATVRPELASLDFTADPATMKARLHRLKGMMGNYGLAACARSLAEWEQDLCAAEGAHRRQTLMAQLEQTWTVLCGRYPWLG